MRVAARISHPGSQHTCHSTAPRVLLEQRAKSTPTECPRLSLRRGDRTPRATAPNECLFACRPRSANHALRSALGRCSGASTAASVRDAARDREPGLRAPVYVSPRSLADATYLNAAKQGVHAKRWRCITIRPGTPACSAVVGIANGRRELLITARRAADLYWDRPFGPVRWRRAERYFLARCLGYPLANARRIAAVRNCIAWSR